MRRWNLEGLGLCEVLEIDSWGNMVAKIAAQFYLNGTISREEFRMARIASIGYTGSLALTMLCLATAGFSPDVSYAGGGIIRYTTAYPKVSLPNAEHRYPTTFACYNVHTGGRLDCSFYFELTGVVKPESEISNNGGHTHDKNRPVTLNHEGLEATGGGHRFDEHTVGGSTLPRSSGVKYPIPTVAGKTVAEVKVNTPDEWYCMSACYTPSEIRYEITYNAGVSGLESLPDPQTGDNYVKARNPTPGEDDDTNHPHSAAFYATPHSLAILRKVADSYNDGTGDKLSVNDMSLPAGGLFDVKGDWNEKLHQFHRDGNDVDINIRGVSCGDDEDLRKAVDEHLSPPRHLPNRESALYCHSGCGSSECKHINLGNLK